MWEGIFIATFVRSAKHRLHDPMQRLVDELAVCIDAAKVAVPEPLHNSATAGSMLRRLQTAQNQLSSGTAYCSDALYFAPTLLSPSSSGGSGESAGHSLPLSPISSSRPMQCLTLWRKGCCCSRASLLWVGLGLWTICAGTTRRGKSQKSRQGAPHPILDIGNGIYLQRDM